MLKNARALSVLALAVVGLAGCAADTEGEDGEEAAEGDVAVSEDALKRYARCEADGFVGEARPSGGFAIQTNIFNRQGRTKNDIWVWGKRRNGSYKELIHITGGPLSGWKNTAAMSREFVGYRVRFQFDKNNAGDPSCTLNL